MEALGHCAHRADDAEPHSTDRKTLQLQRSGRLWTLPDHLTKRCVQLPHPARESMRFQPLPSALGKDLDTRLFGARLIAFRGMLLTKMPMLVDPRAHGARFALRASWAGRARNRKQREAAKGWKLRDAAKLLGALMAPRICLSFAVRTLPATPCCALKRARLLTFERGLAAWRLCKAVGPTWPKPRASELLSTST